MSEHHPTAPAPTVKAAKPARPAKRRPDFPLFLHAAGVWAKKIRGKLHAFGPWDDPNGAFRKYLEQKDAPDAGKKPREAYDRFTVKKPCNQFLNVKQALVASGELTRRSRHDSKDACDLPVFHFGRGRLVADVAPDDFAELRAKMAKRWGSVTFGKVIRRMRLA